MDMIPATTNKASATLSGHRDRVWMAAWHPTQPRLASVSGDKSVRVWTAPSSGQPKSTSSTGEWSYVAIDDAHKRTVRCAAFAPAGDLLTTAGFDGSTAIWEHIGNGEYECVATLEGHENEVKSVAWSASGSLLATCSRDKSVWVWESLGDGDFECIGVLHEHTQDVKHVVWHPSTEVLLSASYDDTLKVWRDKDDDWYCSDTLKGHTSTVWCADFDATGDYLVSVSDDKSIKIWHNSNINDSFTPFTCITTLENAHARAIYSVSWSRVSHGAIATCGGDNCIRIFSFDADKKTLTLLHELPAAHGEFDVNCVRWCPVEASGHLLASAGDDYNVKIWDLGHIVNVRK
ncbi:WD40-repeat-containing domain protein [Chytriomyces sp. MP71]|nr:WD40-repeat-containing domain protein [Chytriomyces sp. MP71]